MLGADVLVAQLQGFAQGELEHLLRARRERDVAGRDLTPTTDDLLHFRPHRVERDAEGGERLCRNPFALAHQPEQDVLGADVVVVEEPRFLLREHHRVAGSVGEALEHASERRARRRTRSHAGCGTTRHRAV